MSARQMIIAAAALVLMAGSASAQRSDAQERYAAEEAREEAMRALGTASLADRFERALVAGDYRVLPLTEDFTYSENGARLDPWDGMWRTMTAVEGAEDFPALDYRVELVDGDVAIRVIEFEENTVQGVMAYRLVARDGQIASVDVLPIREEFGGDRGGTLTLLQPMLPLTMDGELVGAADPSFAGAQEAERTASGIVRAMHLHFRVMTGMGAAHSTPETRYAPDCRRTDNGQAATGVADSAVLDPAAPGYRPYALGCAEQMASGFYSNFALGEVQSHADPARNIGIAFVRLDQSGTVLSFTTPDGTEIAYPGPRGANAEMDPDEQFDGRILTNMISPMSVNGVYIFKFDEDGRISHIDAFYRGAPLGWQGWGTGDE